jgi:pimeloyl-ACP methyl ester carboxylesterase
MADALRATRRAVAAGAGAGVLGMAAPRARAAPTPAAPTTFVLVHGACHGGWCWRRVADRLGQRGHKVYTPTLTGLGERSHLLSKDVRLATHIADIVNVIRWEGLRDVVLAGHSYGGIIISGVAEQVRPAIRSIVFIDALMPTDGASIADHAGAASRAEIAAALARGELALKPPPASAFRVNRDDRAWVDAMMTPQPIATITDTIALTGARERVPKKTYIRAVRHPHREFDKAYAACKADRSWKTFETAGAGHDLMVDAPDWLTERLLDAA